MLDSTYRIVINSLGQTKPISEIPTRQLLRIFREISVGYYNSEHGYVDSEGSLRTVIKKELSAREHVPNKAEAKHLRRVRANKFRSSRTKNN